MCEAAAGVAAERATVERETCGAPPTQMSATRHLTLSPTRKRSVSELTNLLAPSHSRSSPWETTWTCVGARKYSSDTYPRDCAVNNSREGSEADGGGFEPPQKPPDARGEGGSCTLPSLVVAMCLCITSILARAEMTPSIVVKGITAAIVTRLGCCSPPECRDPPSPWSRFDRWERSRRDAAGTTMPYDAYLRGLHALKTAIRWLSPLDLCAPSYVVRHHPRVEVDSRLHSYSRREGAPWWRRRSSSRACGAADAVEAN